MVALQLERATHLDIYGCEPPPDQYPAPITAQEIRELRDSSQTEAAFRVILRKHIFQFGYQADLIHRYISGPAARSTQQKFETGRMDDILHASYRGIKEFFAGQAQPLKMEAASWVRLEWDQIYRDRDRDSDRDSDSDSDSDRHGWGYLATNNGHFPGLIMLGYVPSETEIFRPSDTDEKDMVIRLSIKSVRELLMNLHIAPDNHFAMSIKENFLMYLLSEARSAPIRSYGFLINNMLKQDQNNQLSTMINTLVSIGLRTDLLHQFIQQLILDYPELLSVTRGSHSDSTSGNEVTEPILDTIQRQVMQNLIDIYDIFQADNFKLLHFVEKMNKVSSTSTCSPEVLFCMDDYNRMLTILNKLSQSRSLSNPS